MTWILFPRQIPGLLLHHSFGTFVTCCLPILLQPDHLQEEEQVNAYYGIAAKSIGS